MRCKWRGKKGVKKQRNARRTSMLTISDFGILSRCINNPLIAFSLLAISTDLPCLIASPSIELTQ